ncbi:MAG: hypothetical protein FWE70_00760 [Oscillospiraceae bacterium]|nr:hypothetical protein [Oscillospiraceae bacterium]
MPRIDIKPDPCFERLRRTLTLEGKPDRLPLSDFSIDGSVMSWVLGLDGGAGRRGGRALTRGEVLEFFIASGYDYVCIWPHYDFLVSSASDREGMGRIRTMGDLMGGDWPWRDLDSVSYGNLTDMAAIMPEEMKVIILSHDIFTWVWEDMGFTHFCNCLYEDMGLVEELFRQIGHAVCTITERAAEALGDRLGAIWYADDLAFNTGTFVDPKVYRDNLFPWVRRISSLASSMGAPLIYHSDGLLWDVFDDFADMGVSAIHPLEPKAMDAAEVKARRGGQFCLMGNVDLDLLSRGTPEEVADMVADRIGVLGRGGGYCVGSSNTVPAYVNPLNFKAMVEATFRHGWL